MAGAIFYWCLALFFGFLIGACLIIGMPLLIAWRAGLFHHPGEHLAALILGGVALLFLLFAFFVVGAVVGLFAKDFCVPIMAMEKVGVLDAWRRLLPMLAAEKMAFTGYVLMKIVLAIGNAIIFGIVTLLTLLYCSFPWGSWGSLFSLAVKRSGSPSMSLPSASWSCWVASFWLAIIYLIALINTPAMVFFQSYVHPLYWARATRPWARSSSRLRRKLRPLPALDGPPILEPSIG